MSEYIPGADSTRWLAQYFWTLCNRLSGFPDRRRFQMFQIGGAGSRSSRGGVAATGGEVDISWSSIFPDNISWRLRVQHWVHIWILSRKGLFLETMNYQGSVKCLREFFWSSILRWMHFGHQPSRPAAGVGHSWGSNEYPAFSVEGAEHRFTRSDLQPALHCIIRMYTPLLSFFWRPVRLFAGSIPPPSGLDICIFFRQRLHLSRWGMCWVVHTSSMTEKFPEPWKIFRGNLEVGGDV